MTASQARQDLVVLVADKSMESAMDSILNRPESLEIRPIVWQVYVHPERDPGCLLRSAQFLSSQPLRFAYALVLFDRKGCGRDDQEPSELERVVEDALHRAGWNTRASAICLDPELECWVWSDSPEVATALGWAARQPALRPWLHAQGLWEPGTPKPADPKAAMLATLRETRTPRSASIYGRLAQKVSFRRCSDRAFLRLRRFLRGWFPRAA